MVGRRQEGVRRFRPLRAGWGSAPPRGLPDARLQRQSPTRDLGCGDGCLSRSPGSRGAATRQDRHRVDIGRQKEREIKRKVERPAGIEPVVVWLEASRSTIELRTQRCPHSVHKLGAGSVLGREADVRQVVVVVHSSMRADWIPRPWPVETCRPHHQRPVAFRSPPREAKGRAPPSGGAGRSWWRRRELNSGPNQNGENMPSGAAMIKPVVDRRIAAGAVVDREDGGRSTPFSKLPFGRSPGPSGR